MTGARSIHLVGSTGLSDAEAVFRTLSETVGDRAPRYPDGETGHKHIVEPEDAATAVDFGIGTECGFGRRDASTIPDLLRTHAEVADG